jgi:hypothetical protein
MPSGYGPGLCAVTLRLSRSHGSCTPTTKDEASMIDWTAIRVEYEQGVSLRDIVRTHGSSIATISRCARHDNWVRPITPTETRNRKRETPMPLPVSFPIPDDAATIARIGLQQLAQHLQTDEILPIASHKSLSDALAQYVKVLVTAPRETEAQDVMSIPLNKLSPRTRLAIQRLLDEDEHAQEQEVS